MKPWKSALIILGALILGFGVAFGIVWAVTNHHPRVGPQPVKSANPELPSNGASTFCRAFGSNANVFQGDYSKLASDLNQITQDANGGNSSAVQLDSNTLVTDAGTLAHDASTLLPASSQKSDILKSASDLAAAGMDGSQGDITGMESNLVQFTETDSPKATADVQGCEL